MSNTLRRKRGTGQTVRDGAKQYVDPSCKHHGSCPWCERGRTHASRRRMPITD